jgi:hypothetical protein
MSDRERWIVYPLVFLTLGIALRNQFLPTRRFGAVDLRAGEVAAQKIICNDLEIREEGKCNQLQCGKFLFDDALGKHLRVLGLAENMQLQAGAVECREFAVVNADGKPVVLAGADKNTQSGAIQTINRNGMPLVQIHSSETGGVVTAVGLGGNVVVAMGEEGQNIGVYAHFPRLGQTYPLTTPLPVPGIQKSPQSPSPTPGVPPPGGTQGGGKTP